MWPFIHIKNNDFSHNHSYIVSQLWAQSLLAILSHIWSKNGQCFIAELWKSCNHSLESFQWSYQIFTKLEVVRKSLIPEWKAFPKYELALTQLNKPFFSYFWLLVEYRIVGVEHSSSQKDLSSIPINACRIHWKRVLNVVRKSKRIYSLR